MIKIPRRAPRRQRKRKVHTALSGKEFIEEVNDSFDEGAFEGEVLFEDMFDDLKEISNLQKNLESYYQEFYERIVCGCYGLLAGERAPEAPVNYSMFSCTEEQLEPFCQAFELFLQRFPIMRNMMDKILQRLLFKYSTIPADLQRRLCKIIAIFVRTSYNKSKTDEFFLNTLKSDPNGVNTIADVLDEIKNYQTADAAYEFVQKYNFAQVLKSDDFDYEQFAKRLGWFDQLVKQHQEQQRSREVYEALVRSFQKEDPEAIANATQLWSGKEWISVHLKALLQSLEVSKSTSSVALQNFQKSIGAYKEMISSVELQGYFMELLMKYCYQDPSLNEMFKPCLTTLYQHEIIDGNVVIAWFDRCQGDGKASFSKQIYKFVQWLKQE